MMRIVQISSAESFGGGERHLVDLTRGLAARGHSILACVRPSCTWKERLADAGAARIEEVPLRASIDLMSARRIGKLATEFGAEIIHGHLARDYPAAVWSARLTGGARAVLTRHVLFPISLPTRLLTRGAARWIAVSSGVEDSLRTFVPGNRIAAIPNGIDTDRFRSGTLAAEASDFLREYDIPEGSRVVVTVGELKPLKGQEDFVIAAGEVVKSVPDAFFLVIGRDNSSDGGFRRRLRRLAKVLGLADRFLFLDWVEDTAVVLAASDCFVSPSHSESFGLAILEAMASGTPVVATETAGARQLLDDGNAGSLVPIGEPLEIADAVTRTFEDHKAAGELSVCALERARREFSLDSMVSGTEAVYLEVASEGG